MEEKSLLQARLSERTSLLSSVFRVLATLVACLMLVIEAYFAVTINQPNGFYRIETQAPPPPGSPAQLVSFLLPITSSLVSWLLILLPIVSLLLLLLAIGARFLHRPSERSKETLHIRRAKSSWPTRLWHIGSIVLVCLSLLGLLAITPSFDTNGTSSLASLAFISPTQGWAVGSFDRYNGGNYGTIWQYSQGRWQQRPQVLVGAALNAVTALPDGEAWAVGTGETILHEQGENWTLAYQGTAGNSPSPEDLNAIAMLSPREGWAVGGFFPVASSPAPNTSANVLLALQEAPLHPLASARTYDFCDILHYTAGNWQPVTCPRTPTGAAGVLEGLSVLPDGEAWAVGAGGLILHEQGNVWEQQQSPTGNRLTGIAMVSPTEGWAVGDQSILHYHQGVWTQVSTAYRTLTAITMISPEEGWIVSGDGLILHYAQGTWAKAPASPANYFSTIAMQPGEPMSGWIAGPGDTSTHSMPMLLHFSQGTWSPYHY